MKWKNYHKENCLYFVTATLRKFIPLFLNDDIVKIIFDSLDFLRKNKGLKVYAYVIMPEHLHLIVALFRCEDTPKHQRKIEDAQEYQPPSGDLPEQQKITVLFRDFKKFTSRQIAKYLQSKSPLLFEKCKTLAYKGQNYAIWQETFRAKVIFKEEFLRQKINYLHMNPVRRGLVKNPADWKNSSFNQIWKDDEVAESAFIVDRFFSV